MSNNETKIIKRLVSNAKTRAKDPQKSRGKSDFNLTEDWVKDQMIKQGYKCPYTGVEYDFGIGKSWFGRSGAPGRPSVNRLNPMEGYTMENCEITSNYYNTALSSWTHRDIAKHCVGMAWFMIKKKFGLKQ